MKPREADEGSEEERPPAEVGLRDRLAHFTWPWFAATMSTGALAVVLGNTPNTFTGLRTIGKCFFIFDIILFLLFNGLMMTRFILVPRKIFASLHHPVEGLFFGTYWVSIALILNCAYIYGKAETGDWLNKGLEVTFWMYCAAAFIVGVAQYAMFFHLERLSVVDAVPAWIFPVRLFETPHVVDATDFARLDLPTLGRRNTGRNYTTRTVRRRKLEDVCRWCLLPGSCLARLLSHLWHLHTATHDQQSAVTECAAWHVRIRRARW